MPIYEYRCDSCDHEFEKFLRGGEEEPSNCPECSEPSISRLISNTSFKLKGSGWYETDYARDDEPDPQQAEEGGAEGESETDTASENGADSEVTSDA